MVRSALPMNHILQQGTVFDSCAVLTNWAATYQCTIALDARYGIKMIPTATSGSCHFSKTINTDMRDSDSIDFLVYIPDLTNVDSIVLYLSNATSGLTTNSFNTTIYNTANIQLAQGWNRLSIPKNRWGQIGATNWVTNMLMVRVLVNIKGTGSPVIYLREILKNKVCRKLAVVTSDDGFRGAANFLKTYFNSLNSNGGIHRFGMLISKEYAEQGDADTNSLYAATAELKAVYDAGYELCNHTTSQLDGVKDYTAQQRIDQIKANEDWMLSQGWIRGISHFAYPGSGISWDESSINWILANTRVKTSRTSLNNYASNPYPELMQLPQVSIPDTGNFYGMTKAQYQIDMAADCGATPFLSCHDIKDSGTHTLSITSTAFGVCMDYALRKGFLLVAPEEWYKMITNSRRTIRHN